MSRRSTRERTKVVHEGFVDADDIEDPDEEEEVVKPVRKGRGRAAKKATSGIFPGTNRIRNFWSMIG